MRGAWLVMKKEFLELMKDKRTLFFTFGMPLVLYPLIFGMMTKMATQAETERKSKPSRVYLLDPGSALAPALKADAKDFDLVPAPAGDLAQALRDKKLDLAVEVPATGPADVAASRTLKVTARYNKAEDDSQQALERLQAFLADQGKDWVKARLQALNASPELATPTDVDKVNVADMALQLGKIFGIWLPYILLISMFGGIMNNGASMTAGERERGTLMSLLSTRIPRSQIALGKLLALFVLGVLSAASSVIGSGLGFSIVGRQIAEAGAGSAATSATMLQMAGPSILLRTLILLVPVALLMVSFVLLVGIQARTQREAATALMPGLVVIIVLGVFSMAPGIEKMAAIPYIPIVNASLSIREMFGQHFVLSHFLIALALNTVLAAALTLMAARTLNREDVLFKS
ncbi:MAG TPA: ABC transporter permease [Holophagaceae bacterium]|nr:ABC transporter permease [Holophagaceae bacterium]